MLLKKRNISPKLQFFIKFIIKNKFLKLKQIYKQAVSTLLFFLAGSAEESNKQAR